MASKYPYERNIHNDFLGKSKVIKAMSMRELDEKTYDQRSKWKEEEYKVRKKLKSEEKIKRAEISTIKAKNLIEKYNVLLISSLHNSSRINFNNYIKKSNIKEFSYVKEEILLEDIYKELGVPKKKFWEFLFESLTKKRIEMENEAKKIWQERIDEVNNKYNNALKEYNQEKMKILEEAKNNNDNIYKWENDFKLGKREAVERYITEVLNKSEYPDEIIKEFRLEYNEEEKRLIVLYKMPNSEYIPNIIEYKYVKARDEVDEKFMKKCDFDKFYDDIIYQITLRTINEIFTSTYNECIQEVVFNGWVDYIDKATGRDTSSFIISVKVNKKDFLMIDLSRINYKECIKRLKGIFAGKLISLIPVKPILNFELNDKRFVNGKNVLSETDSSTNLASMDWEDFEHLVRQLFEQKFCSNGAEVKITQASRDGGVDAVIFDPDPIRGGKFIIQAKRYNNVVPVTAVRDLLGTVVNEKAIRGILVTTSYYGSDSYEFIKDNPITLINGNELLAMFNELGYKNLRVELWEQRKK